MSHREAEAIVAADGVVRLDPVRFPPGTRMRVSAGEPVTMPRRKPPTCDPAQGEPLPIEEVQRRLAGTVLHYSDPFAPTMTDAEVDAFAGEPVSPEGQGRS